MEFVKAKRGDEMVSLPKEIWNTPDEKRYLELREQQKASKPGANKVAELASLSAEMYENLNARMGDLERLVVAMPEIPDTPTAEQLQNTMASIAGSVADAGVVALSLQTNSNRYREEIAAGEARLAEIDQSVAALQAEQERVLAVLKNQSDALQVRINEQEKLIADQRDLIVDLQTRIVTATNDLRRAESGQA